MGTITLNEKQRRRCEIITRLIAATSTRSSNSTTTLPLALSARLSTTGRVRAALKVRRDFRRRDHEFFQAWGRRSTRWCIFNDEERPADRSFDHRFRWVSGWLFLGQLLSSFGTVSTQLYLSCSELCSNFL